MKLAIIRQRYNPFGGAERFVERALAGLARTDLDVTLITRRWNGEAGRYGMELCDPPYLGSTWRDYAFARAAEAAVARGGYDLVQSHEKIACCDIYRAGDGVHRAWLARRARQMGPAGRLWLRANLFNHYTLGAEDALYRSPRLRAVVCISELVRRDIQAHFPIDSERLPVIYNGIDTSLYHPGLRADAATVRTAHGIPAEVPLFLFVGSGYERKGLAPLLRALPPEAWLLVVGKDKQEKAYRALAEQLGIASRVRFLGPQHNVRPFYGAADAFAFPTIYEPFGNVILEAMACGLPVVTTPDCGGAELLQEGRSGFVRPTGDSEGLREALGRLCDTGFARQLGDEAARTAAGYSVSLMTERMIGLYRTLLA